MRLQNITRLFAVFAAGGLILHKYNASLLKPVHAPSKMKLTTLKNPTDMCPTTSFISIIQKEEAMQNATVERDNPYDHPLIQAIKANDIAIVAELLQAGSRVSKNLAYAVGLNNDTDPKILDLLNEYNDLPEGCSLSTVKFALYAAGNRRIKPDDFWGKPDLSLNGIPYLQSPITLFARQGNIRLVELLMQLGVTQRPITSFFLGIHESQFMGCDLLEIDKFKQRISDNLNGALGAPLEQQCQIAELFMQNSNSELDDVIEEKKGSFHYSKQFLPFFAWAAINNRADLFANPIFQKLFKYDHAAAKESIPIAAAFGAKEFVSAAMFSDMFCMDTELAAERIACACRIAAANGDNDFLAHSTLIIEPQTPQGIKTRKEAGKYYIESDSSPLFWAVRNDHPDTVRLLLQTGLSANKEIDDVMGECYLALSARLWAKNPKQNEIMQLLLEHGANINHQNNLGRTALHNAASRDSIEAMMFLIDRGADITLVDNENKTAFDLIEDQEKRRELQQYVEQKEPKLKVVPKF